MTARERSIPGALRLPPWCVGENEPGVCGGESLTISSVACVPRLMNIEVSVCSYDSISSGWVAIKASVELYDGTGRRAGSSQQCGHGARARYTSMSYTGLRANMPYPLFARYKTCAYTGHERLRSKGATPGMNTRLIPGNALPI